MGDYDQFFANRKPEATIYCTTVVGDISSRHLRHLLVTSRPLQIMDRCKDDCKTCDTKIHNEKVLKAFGDVINQVTTYGLPTTNVEEVEDKLQRKFDEYHYRMRVKHDYSNLTWQSGYIDECLDQLTRGLITIEELTRRDPISLSFPALVDFKVNKRFETNGMIAALSDYMVTPKMLKKYSVIELMDYMVYICRCDPEAVIRHFPNKITLEDDLLAPIMKEKMESEKAASEQMRRKFPNGEVMPLEPLVKLAEPQQQPQPQEPEVFEDAISEDFDFEDINEWRNRLNQLVVDNVALAKKRSMLRGKIDIYRNTIDQLTNVHQRYSDMIEAGKDPEERDDGAQDQINDDREPETPDANDIRLVIEQTDSTVTEAVNALVVANGDIIDAINLIVVGKKDEK